MASRSLKEFVLWCYTSGLGFSGRRLRPRNIEVRELNDQKKKNGVENAINTSSNNKNNKTNIKNKQHEPPSTSCPPWPS